MLKKIGLAVAVLVVILVGVIVMRPDAVTVERSAAVGARPEVAYGLVADFHGWSQWSPWEALDPGMKKTFEGAPSGKGAIYSWVGNDQVGEGRMTILDAEPGKEVDIKLEFIKPFAATNDTRFSFKPDGGKTTVTWTMNAKQGFMMKAMGLFKSMDEMVGPDFEKGLSKMKTVAEAEEKKRVADELAKKAADEAAAKKAADEAAAKKAADDAAAAEAEKGKKGHKK